MCIQAGTSALPYFLNSLAVRSIWGVGDGVGTQDVHNYKYFLFFLLSTHHGAHKKRHWYVECVLLLSKLRVIPLQEEQEKRKAKDDCKWTFFDAYND